MDTPVPKHAALTSFRLKSHIDTACKLQVLCGRIYEIRVPDVISYTAAPCFVFCRF